MISVAAQGQQPLQHCRHQDGVGHLAVHQQAQHARDVGLWYDQGSASIMTATVNGAARAVYGDDEPGPFGPIRLGGIMNDTPLAGRVAVVSGGGRGLGRSFCLALARQGAKVVVNNRNRGTDADGRGPADHVAAEIIAAGGEAVAEHSDAADPAGGEAIVTAAVERWGRLDICVANAAIGPGGMFHKQPAAQFGEVLEINLQGSVRLARAAMAVLRPPATAGSSWSAPPAGCTATSGCPPTRPARAACWPSAGRWRRRARARAC